MPSDMIPSETPSNAMFVADQRAGQNPAAVYLASLGSEYSRRTMHGALDTIAGILSNGHETAATLRWGLLRFQHTQAARAALADRYAPATANKMLSALRGALERAYKLGYMTPDEYAKTSDIDGIKGTTVLKWRDLSADELSALVRVCNEDESPAGSRDQAMLGVLYTCGLRRAELVALDLADYDTEIGRLTVCMGKGRKARTVYASEGAQDALDTWISQHGQEDGPLFTAIGMGSRLTGRRMTTQAVYFILKKRAVEARVKDFSPRDLRRTFVGDMLDSGVGIAIIAKITGHASVTTTARYDRRQEEVKRKAAGLLHFPH